MVNPTEEKEAQRSLCVLIEDIEVSIASLSGQSNNNSPKSWDKVSPKLEAASSAMNLACSSLQAVLIKVR